MRTLRLFWRATALTLLGGLAACDDGGGASADAGLDGSGDEVTDTGGDGCEADACGPDDTTPDTTDEDSTDGSGDTAVDTYPQVSCVGDDDSVCPDNGFCKDGSCVPAPTCRDLSDWPKCERLMNAIRPDLGRFGACIEGVCRVRCTMDQDCGEGEFCTDYGDCLPFNGEITGQHPGGEVPGEFRAGFGNTLMKFPIGTELGGFGERAAFDDGRYATTLRASAGEIGGQYARAMLLDNGERQIMVIRLPVIFTEAALQEDVARALQARTGRDWRDSLVISSTHTHSGPCRHWHMPTNNAAPIGAFGIGNFNQYFYDWLLESSIAAANQALDDLRPARFGAKIVEAYDTDDQIGRDRWNQTPHFDDNRLLLMRVDEPDGTPRGVLFSFAAHGTLNESDYLTGDALGGAEDALEYAMSQRAGSRVLTLYVNQSSGTMSPAGDVVGHDFPQAAERLGEAFVSKALSEIDSIETKTDVELDAVTHRFPVTYDLLGYERGQFAAPQPRPFGGEYHFGGLSCVDGQRPTNDSDPTTFQRTDHLVCSAALHFLIFNRPPTMLLRSQITAMKIDGISIVTMPGELAEELSWDVLRALRDRWGIDPMKAWTFGYAQDHFFYLMPTNLRGDRPPFPGFPAETLAPDEYPEFTFSFLQGGYESTVSPWGPLLGDYMRERAVDAMGRLLDAEYEPRTPPTYPGHFTHVEEPPFPVETTPADRVGVVLEDIPERVTRFEPVEFAWVGGDPGAEMPQAPLVTLQRELPDGSFEAAQLPNFEPYTNRSARMMTRPRQPDEIEWQWVVRWEEIQDFPAGRYRFAVSGHYLSEDGDTEMTPYLTYSRVFEFVPSDGLLLTLDQAGGEVSGTIGYPPEQRMRFSSDNFEDPGSVTGNFRIRNWWVGSGQVPPVIAGQDLEASGIRLRVLQGTTEVASIDSATLTLATAGTAGGPRNPQTEFRGALPTDLAPGAYTLRLEVTDLHGNTGVTETSITIP